MSVIKEPGIPANHPDAMVAGQKCPVCRATFSSWSLVAWRDGRGPAMCAEHLDEYVPDERWDYEEDYADGG